MSSETVSNVQIFDVASVHVKWILHRMFNLNDFDAILPAGCVFSWSSDFLSIIFLLLGQSYSSQSPQLKCYISKFFLVYRFVYVSLWPESSWFFPHYPPHLIYLRTRQQKNSHSPRCGGSAAVLPLHMTGKLNSITLNMESIFTYAISSYHITNRFKTFYIQVYVSVFVSACQRLNANT